MVRQNSTVSAILWWYKEDGWDRWRADDSSVSFSQGGVIHTNSTGKVIHIDPCLWNPLQIRNHGVCVDRKPKIGEVVFPHVLQKMREWVNCHE